MPFEVCNGSIQTACSQAWSRHVVWLSEGLRLIGLNTFKISPEKITPFDCIFTPFDCIFTPSEMDLFFEGFQLSRAPVGDVDFTSR